MIYVGLTLWAIFCISIGAALGNYLHMKVAQWYFSKCTMCGKRSKDRGPSQRPCSECFERMRSEQTGTEDLCCPPVGLFASGVTKLQDMPPDSGNLAAEFAKQIVKDPEGMKAFRKLVGLESERERFEAEAEEPWPEES